VKITTPVANLTKAVTKIPTRDDVTTRLFTSPVLYLKLIHMIRCRFIYRLAGGGNSDSLDAEYSVCVIPRVGELIQFLNEDGDSSEHTVLGVKHNIFTGSDTSHVVVFYGEAE